MTKFLPECSVIFDHDAVDVYYRAQKIIHVSVSKMPETEDELVAAMSVVARELALYHRRMGELFQ